MFFLFEPANFNTTEVQIGWRNYRSHAAQRCCGNWQYDHKMSINTKSLQSDFRAFELVLLWFEPFFFSMTENYMRSRRRQMWKIPNKSNFRCLDLSIWFFICLWARPRSIYLSFIKLFFIFRIWNAFFFLIMNLPRFPSQKWNVSNCNIVFHLSSYWLVYCYFNIKTFFLCIDQWVKVNLIWILCCRLSNLTRWTKKTDDAWLKMTMIERVNRRRCECRRWNSTQCFSSSSNLSDQLIWSVVYETNVRSEMWMVWYVMVIPLQTSWYVVWMCVCVCVKDFLPLAFSSKWKWVDARI